MDKGHINNETRSVPLAFRFLFLLTRIWSLMPVKNGRLDYFDERFGEHFVMAP